MDDPALIDKFEDELWQLIEKMHKANVRYEVIFDLVKRTKRELIIRNQGEKCLEGDIQQ